MTENAKVCNTDHVGDEEHFIFYYDGYILMKIGNPTVVESEIFK